jgi:hypothetical protein
VTPAIAQTGEGTAIAAWEDLRDGVADIYASRVLDDVGVSAKASLLQVDARAGSIRLTWFVPGTGSDLFVSRRTESTFWESIASVEAEPSRRVVFEDIRVVPGVRYGYRLELRHGLSSEFTEPTWIEVPAKPHLLLHGAYPNPVTDRLRIAFELPDSKSVRLEILDVTGRVVLRRKMSGLSEGGHVVDVGPSNLFAPGLYCLSIEQDGRRAVSRVLISR